MARPSGSLTVGTPTTSRSKSSPGPPLDYDELLGVLLPEVGAVRLDDVEQLGHDGRHADKMPGPRGPFVEVGDGAGSTLVSAPGRYISSGVGVKTRLTPAASSMLRSRSRSRGMR